VNSESIELPAMPFTGEETTVMMPSMSIIPDILIVDDDPVLCAVLQREVEAAGFSAEIALHGEAALRSLQASFAPLVILDLDMPGMHGLEVCRRIRAQQYPGYVYIIIRSILDEERNIIEGFEAGADEYLSKQTSPAQLLARLKTAQRILSLEHALKRMVSERRKMALTDALTGAFNRRYFMKYAQRNVQRAQSTGTELSLLALDIDHFKAINDQHGHDAGDVVLVECVRRIHATLRREEWCARMGGEEFSVLLPQSDLQRAQRIAERIRAAVAAAPFRVGQTDIPVTISVGVSGLSGREPPHSASVDLLLRQADECLYRSKRSGRNRVTLLSPKKF
jgi:two-component system, cell cycle response regulator